MYKCYFPATRSERDCDTLTFIPNVIPFPKVTIEDFLKQTAMDIIHILSQPVNASIPTLETGSNTRNDLLKLATILDRTDIIPVLQELEAVANKLAAPRPKTNTNSTIPEPRVSMRQK